MKQYLQFVWQKKIRYRDRVFLKHNILQTIAFFQQFLQAPLQVGSVCPSSRFLTRALARTAFATSYDQGLIVDLGAGSGVVSRELLRNGVDPHHILALDISPEFKRIFHRRCPQLKLHIGDARNLGSIISQSFPDLPVKAVISSLPLRSMPLHVIREIMAEVRQVLCADQGILVQYTYALWMRACLENFGFSRLTGQYVFLNMPPALVEMYCPVQ